MKYHLALDGFIITDTPMTLEAIIAAFGEIKKLEKEGFKLIRVSNYEYIRGLV